MRLYLPFANTSRRRVARSPEARAKARRRLLIESMEDRRVLATVHWDGGADGTGTLWANAENWVGDVIPGASDDAVIGDAYASRVIEIQADTAVAGINSKAALSLSSGTLSVGSATLDNSLTVAAGAVLVAGPAGFVGAGSILNQGTILASGSAFMVGVENRGQLDVQTVVAISGLLTTTTTSIIRIPASIHGNAALVVSNGFTNHGLIELTSDSSFWGRSDLVLPSGALTNSPTGTIRSLSGSRNDGRFVEGSVVNHGTVDVQESLYFGNYLSNHGLEAGNIQVAANTGLYLRGTTDYSGGTFSGTGDVFVSAATLNLSQNLTLPANGPRFQLQNATVNGPATMINEGQTSLLGSTFHSPVENRGQFDAVYYNTISGPLTTTTTSVIRIPATIDRNSALIVSSGFTNHGLIELTSDSIFYGRSDLAVQSGALTNSQTGTIRSLSGSRNDGRFIEGSVVNQGTIDVQESLYLGNYLSSHGLAAGNIQVAANTGLYLSGTTEYSGGAFSGTGDVFVSLGTLNLSQNLTLPANGPRFQFQYATVNGPASMINEGQTSLLGSTFHSPVENRGQFDTVIFNTINGPLTTTTTSVIRIAASIYGNAALTVSNGFTNHGLIDLTSASYSWGRSDLVVQSGGLTNSPTGTIRSSSGARNDGRFVEGSVVNHGTVDVQESLYIGNFLAIANSPNLGLGGGDLQVAATKSLYLRGIMEYAGGSFSGTGDVQVLGGPLNLSQNLTLPANGPRFQFQYATVNGPATLINEGQITLVGSTLNSPMENRGFIVVTAGNAFINGPLTTTSNSSIAITAIDSPGRNLLAIANGFDNNGSILLYSILDLDNDVELRVQEGVLSNSPTGNIVTVGNNGGRHIFAGAGVLNSGTITVDARTTLNKLVNLSGLIAVNSSSLTLSNLGLDSNGYVTIADGAVLRAGSLTGNSINQTVFTGRGTLQLDGELFPDGSRELEAFGHDYGPVARGFVDNFVIKTLELRGAVRLVDLSDNLSVGLIDGSQYIEKLILRSGADLDLNGLKIYVLELQDGGATVRNGQIEVVSRPWFVSDGALHANNQISPISRDGQVVAYYNTDAGPGWGNLWVRDFRNQSNSQIAAYGLLAGVTDNGQYVLWHDGYSQLTMTEIATGNSTNLPVSGTVPFLAFPVLNGEGTHVAYVGSDNQIYRVGVQETNPQLISANTSGQSSADGYFVRPSISDDGRYVLFESNATDLVLNDNNGWGDIFLRDTLLGETHRVNTTSSNVEADSFSGEGVLSGDGSTAVFWSMASNLHPNGSGNFGRVYAKNLETGALQLVSADSNGVPLEGATGQASISDNGRYVTFRFVSSGNGPAAAFRKDLWTAELVPVSVFESDAPVFDASHVALSGNGQFAVVDDLWSAVYRIDFGGSESSSEFSLSNNQILENETANAVVGTFTATNPSEFGPLTFELISGSGDADNAYFYLDGSSLRTNQSFDFESRNSFSIRVRATDTGDNTIVEKFFTITVNNVNEAPSLSVPANNYVLNENTLLQWTSTAYDVDNSDRLTFSLVNAPQGALINVDSGEFRWNPSEQQGPGTYSFYVRVTDLAGLLDQEWITVQVVDVEDAPVLTLPATQFQRFETETFTFTAVGIDKDIPAQTLSFSLIDAPNGASIDAQSGVFTWTPSETQGGAEFRFKVRVTDTTNLFDEREVMVNVMQRNENPVLTLPQSVYAIPEQELFSFIATASDSDLPANTLTYSLLGNVPSGSTFNASTGEFRWRPTEQQGSFEYTFSVRVSDGQGGEDTKPVRIIVEEINRAPVFDFIDGNLSLAEGSVYTARIRASDPDMPVNNITLTAVNLPPNATFNPATGDLRWEIGDGPATHQFNFRATDDGSPPLSTDLTFTRTIYNVAPDVVLNFGDELNWSSGNTVLSGRILDPGQDAIASSTYELERLSNYQWIAGGNLSLDVAGNFQITRSLPQSGLYRLRITATDDEGATQTVWHQFRINPPQVVGTSGDDVLQLYVQPTGGARLVLNGVELGQFSEGLASFQGLAGNDTLELIGTSAADEFNLANEAGNQIYRFAGGAIRLEGIEVGRILGEGGADRFWIGAGANAQLFGGDGDDEFHMQATSLTGRVDGGVGSNFLTYRTVTSNVNVNLTTGAATGISSGVSNITRLEGGFGNDLMVGNELNNVFLASAGSDSIDGRTGSDTLESNGSVATWTLTAANAGTAAGGMGTSTFTAIETIMGGNSLVGRNTTNTWTLTGGYQGTVGTMAFSYVGSIRGGTATDTLVGPSIGSFWRWTVDEANTGRLDGGVAFAGIENLTGGSVDDIFLIRPTGSISGTITGGADLRNVLGGGDSISYTDWNTSVTFNLSSSSASNVLRFATIENLVGGSASDELIGTNSNSHWYLSGPNQGRVGVIGFQSIETLQGGTGNDLFELERPGARVVAMRGGIGTDTVQGPASNLEAGSKEMAFRVIGNGSGTVAIGSTVSAQSLYSEIEALVGGIEPTTFLIEQGSSFINSVRGTIGLATVDYGAWTTPVVVDARTNSASSIGSFSAVRFLGSAQDDHIIGRDATNTWTVTGLNRGVAGTFAYESFEQLIGGSGNDTFRFTTDQSRISGGVQAGDGVDTFTGPNFASTYRMTGTGMFHFERDGHTTEFSGVESVTAGTAADEFIVFPGASLIGSINGGTATGTVDVLDLRGRPGSAIQLGTTNRVDGFAAYSGFERVIGSGLLSDEIRGSNANTSFTLAENGSATLSNIVYEGFDAILGGTGVDTLRTPNVASTWTIDSVGGGTVAFGPSIIRFGSMENATAGTGDDLVKYQGSGRISGTLNLGTGTDQIDLSELAGTVQINTGSSRSIVDRAGTFTGVERVLGNLNPSSSIVGSSILATAWAVDAAGQIVVNSVTYSDILRIESGPLTDTLTGPNSNSYWIIQNANAGQLSLNGGASILFFGIDSLVGGTADDAFEIKPTGSLAGNLSGGTGRDSLSYVDWITNVRVDLSQPSTVPLNATGISGHTGGIEMVMAGNGNDTLIAQAGIATILLGGLGNDSLRGGSGRDILIGGLGADTIEGLGGDDLLIAGETSYDRDRVALLLVQSEWTNTTRNFATRVSNLRGTGTGQRSNNTVFLNITTVFSDSEFVDRLTGDLTGGPKNQDWFWGELDEIVDLVATGSSGDQRI